MTAASTAADLPWAFAPAARAGSPGDRVRLEVSDIVVDVLTGVYSEETHRPQPLRISVTAELAAPARFEPDTPLPASKNYLDLRHAIERVLRPVYGRDTALWMRRWRWFFLATSGLFGYADGGEWGVSHYRMTATT